MVDKYNIQKLEEAIENGKKKVTVFSQHPTYQEYVKLREVMGAGEEIEKLIQSQMNSINTLNGKLKDIKSAENYDNNVDGDYDEDESVDEAEPQHSMQNTRQMRKQQPSSISQQESKEAIDLGLDTEIPGMPDNDIFDEEAEPEPPKAPEPKPAKKKPFFR